jgi:hypothetical protein
MIWHIFRKDWRLLWGFVAIVAALQGIAELVLAKARTSEAGPMLDLMAQSLPILTFFAATFLIVAVVHLDAIPGLRQDWLTRPIHRGHLLAEKLLFVVIAVEGPILLADVLLGLACGFSFRSVLLVAAERVAYLLFFLVLPIFAFASVTKNMTEAFILGCGCTFISGVFLTLSDSVNWDAHNTLATVAHTGVGWIGELTRFAIISIAAIVILRFQYFFRRTAVSRTLVILFGTLLLLTVFLPWKPIFAIEERLSPDPAAAANLSLAFYPAAGKYHDPSGLRDSYNIGAGRYVEVFLPLRVSGLQANQTLITDHGDLRILGPDRTLAYRGSTIGIEVENAGSDSAGESRHQRITLPASLYNQLQDQSVRAELEYSFTLFGLSKSYAIPAVGGDERMPGWGWCQTKLNDAGTAVSMKCMAPGNGPTCGGIFLENPSRATQNPERFACSPDYSPYSAKPIPDAFARFGATIPFRDPSGLAKYPVDGPQLPSSRVVVRVYEPLAHFTRSLEIAQLKLGDWTPR